MKQVVISKIKNSTEKDLPSLRTLAKYYKVKNWKLLPLSELQTALLSEVEK